MGDQVYRFTCNAGWEVVNDSAHDTITEAKAIATQLYAVRADAWVKTE